MQEVYFLELAVTFAFIMLVFIGLAYLSCKGQECKYCKGTGLDKNTQMPCPYCEGTGRV